MHDVDVLVTVYNGMPELEEAVASLRGQTLRSWRCVIVDDGSTDGTAGFLAALEDARFVVLRQEENRGTAAAAKLGLERCDAEFLARMDADDVSLPTRLEEQLAFLRAHPEVGLVGAQIAPLGSAGVGGSLRLPTTHERILADLLAGRHGMAHSCIMLRTELLKRIGGYWSHRLNDAWDMMLRMGEVSRLANLDRVLHHYRVHEGSQNGRALRRMRFSVDYACESALRRRAGRAPISPEEFAAARASRPWWRRLAEEIDLHARLQYRLAVAERLGRHPWRGTLRLAWAALCAPDLTLRHLSRRRA